MTLTKLVTILLLLVSTESLAQGPLTLEQWVAQVQADHVQAETLVEQGALRPAADLLAQSWRNLPPAYPQLADTAFASMQLLLFVMEYLMDEPTVSQFIADSLSQTGDSNKFVRVLYDIAIGQETPGKTQAAIEMTYLTESSNPFVRIGALYMLSEPYYFRDQQFVSGMSSILARDFPNLTVTQEALRLSLYEVCNEDPETIKQVLTVESSDPQKAQVDETSTKEMVEAAAVMSIVQNDPVAACLKEALPDLAADAPRAFQKICDTTLNAPDWRTRYGCLRIAEKRSQQFAAAFAATFSTLAKRADPTPDVARAHIMAGNEFRRTHLSDKGQEPVGEATRATIQLLQTRFTAFPYERNLYEDILKEAQNMADWMAKNGLAKNAGELYQALAQRYPNSLVSAACVNKLRELSTH